MLSQRECSAKIVCSNHKLLFERIPPVLPALSRCDLRRTAVFETETNVFVVSIGFLSSLVD
ncbi:hypothetical protein RESH_05771 [Rhodopirellula europaea SH398]|uniref:Uncharacterized protein n=1 Tax=Rhodopirellula europaea SH398 TaxID=1263868 RepID=M5RWM1_9BACT|nr:hypothetical protein RESH_05771 [Rhodopirellula europaea SH398]